jgi:hypothetical protein
VAPKNKPPRFLMTAPGTQGRNPPVGGAPDEILYEPPRDAAPAAPPVNAELLYIPEPVSAQDQTDEPEPKPEAEAVAEPVPEAEAEPDPEPVSGADDEPQPEPEGPDAPPARAPAAVTGAASAMIEPQVRELRSELALLIEHATASMARIDRLLTAARDIDATDVPPPAGESAPSAPVVVDQHAAARGRGFVGGWRPRRD